MPTVSIRRILPAAAALLAAGCGEPPAEMGLVTGVVTAGGKPLAEVSVTFAPVLGGGLPGPTAQGVTDQDGRYSLTHQDFDADPDDPVTLEGVPPGQYKVVVVDHKMITEMLPPPGRIPQPYGATATTPVRCEVKVGPQTFDISVEGTPADQE